MKLIEQYHELKKKMQTELQAGKLRPEQLFLYQELNYRVDVLETMRDFCQSAPVTCDASVLVTHFRIVDTYIRFLLGERRVGCQTDEKGQKERETAYQALNSVVQDYLKRFAGFQPAAPELYRKSISDTIQAFLCVWLQYRTTYISIQKEV